MKPLLINNPLSKEIKETISTAAAQTRSKNISAIDVWNIQRQKRNFIQRRCSF